MKCIAGKNADAKERRSHEMHSKKGKQKLKKERKGLKKKKKKQGQRAEGLMDDHSLFLG